MVLDALRSSFAILYAEYPLLCRSWICPLSKSFKCLFFLDKLQKEIDDLKTELEQLEKELEYLRAENAILKKLREIRLKQSQTKRKQK